MSTLENFVPAFGRDGYVARRPQLPESRLRWIWRNNREAMLAAGAMIELGNRLYAHPDKADAFIVEYGRRQALGGVRASA